MVSHLLKAKEELINRIVGELEELFKCYKLGEISYGEVASEIKKAGTWFI